jgi:hypothetical protein
MAGGFKEKAYSVRLEQLDVVFPYSGKHRALARSPRPQLRREAPHQRVRRGAAGSATRWRPWSSRLRANPAATRSRSCLRQRRLAFHCAEVRGCGLQSVLTQGPVITPSLFPPLTGVSSPSSLSPLRPLVCPGLPSLALIWASLRQPANPASL